MGRYQVTTEGGVYEIETEDVAPSSPDMGSVGNAMSGYLGGLAGLGDLASTVNKYNPFGGLWQTLGDKIAGTEEPTPTAGDYLRQTSDALTGIDNSTQLGQGTLARKMGEYLPGVMMGGESLLGNGLTGAAKVAAKTLGADAITATGGYLGDKIGGPLGEIGGAIAAGSLPQIAAKGLGSMAGSFEDVAQGAREKALGVQFGDKSRSLGKYAVYLDDAGNAVAKDALDKATDVEAPIQQQIQGIVNKGMLDNAPNDPGALKIYLEKQKAGIGKEIRSLTDEAHTEIGKTAILPDFTKAEEYINSFRGTTKAKLQKVLNGIKADYANESGEGFKKLTGFTDKLQKETKFDPLTPSETTQLKRFAAFDLRNTAESLFDEMLPKKAGAFSEANKTYAALSNLGQTIGKRIAKPIPGIGDYLKGGSLPMAILGGATYVPLGAAGPGIAGGALLAKALTKGAIAKYPMTASRALKQMSSTADLGASALQSMPSIPQSMAALVSRAPGVAESLGLDLSKGSELPKGQGQSRSAGILQSPQNLSSSNPTTALPSNPENKSSQIPEIKGPNSFIDRAIKRAEAKMTGDVPEAPKVVDVAPAESAAPKALVKAVIAQESGGNAKAVSDKGALGLMQIMPATAKEIAAELGIKKYDLKDPETNKMFGEYYLSKLLEKYDGDEGLALTAYHSGPGRVDRLLAKTDGSSLEDILAVPYNDGGLGPVGRKYAKQVLARKKKLEGQLV